MDRDEELFMTIQCEALDYQLSNARLKVPQGKSHAQSYMKDVAEDCLIGAVICLKQESGSSSEQEAESIGTIHLSKISPHMMQHRHTDIGIDIIPQHQGKGYGGQAIRWVTQWAFEQAGLNRIQLRAFEYNTRALHLYQKLGFKQEGRWREYIWHKGRFWDDVQFSMLAREWHAIQKESYNAQSLRFPDTVTSLQLKVGQ
jgi:RimJ/RimL family protein N-acetyltransferase